MKINGSRILLECLKKEGVTDVFGYPGGQVVPLYNEMYDFKGINHILVRHEQGASHAADGYSRASDKVGVCIATSGPGATNLVTGIMTAYMDSTPMVAITGQVPMSFIGKDAFQETDITGITLPITKHNYLVKDISEIPRVVKEAFYIAKSGRPGPVLIDIPKNIQIEEIDKNEFNRLCQIEMDLPGYNPTLEGHPKQIKMAIKLIEKSERPLVLAGAGVINSKGSEELIEFIEKLNIPIATTFLGLGSIPSDHKLNLGMLGMHGSVPANYAVYDSDLIIALGMRFDDRATGKLESFAPNSKVIHIDIDPAEISKNKKPDVPIVGDVKKVLTKLNQKTKESNNSKWIETINSWKNEYKMWYKKGDGKIKAAQVIEELNRITKGDAIIVTDVGQHQMWTAQFYKFKNPGSLISSGGAGTMGYGVPAAMGAKLANPDKQVIAIVGDGGFQMMNQELMTMKQYGIDVKVIIMNNSYLGMVRQWQELFFDKRYSAVDLNLNPDFQFMAKAYKMKGIKIDKPEELGTKLEEVLSLNESVLIEVVIEKEDNVYPMVPSGGDNHKMIGLKEDM